MSYSDQATDDIYLGWVDVGRLSGIGASFVDSAGSGGVVFGRAFFCEMGVKKVSRARFFDMLSADDRSNLSLGGVGGEEFAGN